MGKSGTSGLKIKFNIVKCFVFVAAVILFMAGFYYLYMKNYTNVETQTAVYTEVTDKIEVKGYAVRDEQIVYTDTRGVCAYNVTDGGRVSSGSTVAYVYPSVEQAEIHQQIKRLSSEISKLEDLNSSNRAVYASDINLLSKEIDDKITKLISANDAGDYAKIDELREQLLYLMTKYNIITNTDNGVDSQLVSLNGQLSSLTSSFTSTPVAIGASKTGYFISKVDGYEGILTVDKVLKMSADDFNKTVSSVKNYMPGSDVVGKISTGFNWYFACVLDKEDTDNLEYKNNNGVEIKLVIKSCSNNILPVELKTINKRDDGSSLVVLECNNMSEQLADLRCEDASIILESYKGIGISSKAIRTISRDVTDLIDKDCTGSIEKDEKGIERFVIRDKEGKNVAVASYVNPYHVVASKGKDGKTVFIEQNVKIVYVILADKVNEKQVEILYNSPEKDLTVCKIMTGTSSELSHYIKLYDEVAVSGKGLYNGKIVHGAEKG